MCERIVESRDFLDHGVEYIKPMMLKDIAEDTASTSPIYASSAESTRTPQGTIELRRFFTGEWSTMKVKRCRRASSNADQEDDRGRRYAGQ